MTGEKFKMALQDLHRKINDIELLLSQDNVQYEDLDKQIREAKVDLQQCKPDLDREVATALTDMLETIWVFALSSVHSILIHLINII